jgi:hypothetical protein
LIHFLKVFFKQFIEGLGPSTTNRNVINIYCLTLILLVRD